MPTFPANIKVPLYWVEVDSVDGWPADNQSARIAGSVSWRTSGGSATEDIAVPIGSQAQADAQFGEGSELARMFRAFFANNFANEVWGLPVAEPQDAAAATGDIVIAAPPSAAGTIHLYIAGDYVPVNVLTTDTIATIAANIADAINANTDLPVTAVAAVATVTLTSVFNSVNANEITVITNYYGSVGGEQTPVGLGITLPTNGLLSGASGTPVFDTAITNLGEEPFEYVAMPYTDTNSLFVWDQEYGFTDQGRWGWQRELFGHIISAKRGTYADLLLFGDTMNSGVESIMSFEVASPSPCFEWAAAYTAKTQRAFINDPARPLQALTLNQIKAAPIHQRFDFVRAELARTSNGRSPFRRSAQMVSR